MNYKQDKSCFEYTLKVLMSFKRINFVNDLLFRYPPYLKGVLEMSFHRCITYSIIAFLFTFSQLSIIRICVTDSQTSVHDNPSF